jgi:hypothetical protein
MTAMHRNAGVSRVMIAAAVMSGLVHNPAATTIDTASNANFCQSANGAAADRRGC